VLVIGKLPVIESVPVIGMDVAAAQPWRAWASFEPSRSLGCRFHAS
jgi:hypothetical protein